MSSTEEWGGANRAAILLLSIGEEDAAAVLKHMGPREVQRLGTVMASMSNVSRAQVSEALETFTRSVDDQTSLGVGSEDYIRNMMVQALGEDKAGSVVDRILSGRNSKGLEALKWMDSRAVAEIISHEHPQIVAIVISHLDPDQAAAVVGFLPESARSDVMLRIASLDGIQPGALQELDSILERQFSGNANIQSSTVGGVKSAANILNFMDSTAESQLIEQITEADAAMGEKIQELMFVFDNLAEIDDRGMQALLREVQSDLLVLALKGADQAVKDKILRNMSKRAGEVLSDDLEAKGPVRLSDVEGAQKEILGTARRMAEAGDLVLSSGGGEEYV